MASPGATVEVKGVQVMDLKLEAVVVPVRDVDEAKQEITERLSGRV
jgi:hypothetical protein